MFSAAVISALARSLMAGEQTPAAAHARALHTLGHPWPWLEPLAQRYLERFAAGAIAAAAVTRVASGLLYHVSPRDPVAFGTALIVMCVAALAATVIPAWRAARIDPVRALRLE